MSVSFPGLQGMLVASQRHDVATTCVITSHFLDGCRKKKIGVVHPVSDALFAEVNHQGTG